MTQGDASALDSSHGTPRLPIGLERFQRFILTAATGSTTLFFSPWPWAKPLVFFCLHTWRRIAGSVVCAIGGLVILYFSFTEPQVRMG